MIVSDSMNVLIIGCGYVGRRAARRWIDSGARVTALTRTAENAQQLSDAGITPVVGDVTRPETLDALPAADVVLHAVGLDRQSGHSQREVYVNGLEHILQRLAERTRRFVYVSSTSVYGQNSGEEIDEQSVCSPTAPNGQVCLDAERLLSRYFPSTNRQRSAVILRLSGIYGPGRLIARIATLQSGELLSGNPDAWLNLIHVEDAVSAIVSAAVAPDPAPLYLVSDDRPITRREYYETLAGLVKAPAPKFQAVSDVERAQLNKRCSNRRLRQELEVALQFPDIATGLRNATL